MKNIHIGSSFDDFLEEEGLLDECTESAIKKVIAYQINEMMQKKHLSKTAMANQMGTSRASLERLLDPDNEAVTLKTMKKAASVLGKRLSVEFV
jgi:antitoxin HicB